MKTDYIPLSKIKYLRPSLDGGPGTDGIIVIKLNNGEVWISQHDIKFSRHGSGIEGDFVQEI